MKQKEKQPRSKPSRTVPSRYAFVLIILCVLVYANGLIGDFVWDDQVQLFRNKNIRTLDYLPRAFTSSFWSFMYSADPTADNSGFDLYYRPIQTVIYILVYQLAGLSPFAYHLTNVILHCIATLFVFLLCLELGFDSFIGLLAASLFAVHPVHTESVTWIAGVGDVACGIFYFGALLTFFRYIDSQKPKWLWMSSGSLLLALFSKEMAATFPVVVFLLLMTQKKKRRNLKGIASILWPYALVMGIYAAFRIVAIGLHAGVSLAASVLDWVTLVIWALGSYLRYAIVPYPLYIFHLVPLHFSDRILSTLIYAALLTAVAVVFAVWRRRFSDQFVWLAIFFVTLLPVLYFKGIGGFFAERYLYIPSMAMIVVAGFFLAQLNRKYALLVTGAVVGIFSIVTIQRNRDWQNEEGLYGRTLQYQPEAVNVWGSLGEVYLRQGDNTRAQHHFESALQRMQDGRFTQTPYETYRVHHGLGLAAARQGKPSEAIAHLEKAIEVYPQGDAAYTTLGGVLVNEGVDYGRAAALLETAMKLNPLNDLARDYIGVALLKQGQGERASQYFREALAINPDLGSAKEHLELALRVTKK